MRILQHFFIFILLNAGLLYLCNVYFFPDTFVLTGGLIGYGFSALFLSLLELFIKPALKIIFLPLRFIAPGIIQFFLNGLLLLALEWTLDHLDFFSVSLQIEGIIVYVISGFLFALLHFVFEFFYSHS